MAQAKYTVAITNGSQTVSVAGQNVAPFIKANHVFMVMGEFVPYFVAADATFNGTDTTFALSGAYQGATNPAAPGVIATGKTANKDIPTLAQGDVGTASIFTLAMYRIEELLAQSGAGGDLSGKNSDALVEGIANLYFTAARVRATALSGLTAQNAIVDPADSLLTAVGKLQGQQSAHIGSRGPVHGEATQFEPGFMSREDKAKLDKIATPTVSATPPASPIEGQLWTSTNGVTYVWVVSGSRGAWVQTL